MGRHRSGLWPAVAAAMLLIWASVMEPLARGGEPRTEPAAGPTEPDPSSAALAHAVRACDLADAQDVLESEAGADSFEPGLILGLAAESCGLYSLALERLRAARGDSEMEDWRLYAIARSAIALGQHPAAMSALDLLRAQWPASPLFGAAIVSAAELARERDDLEGVIELTRQSRSWPLDAQRAEALEVAAWHAGSELGDGAIRAEIAARLLVEHPLVAAKLKVIEQFRAPDGSIDWLSFLDHDQMVRRAESLLRAGLIDSAMDTLAQVAQPNRGLSWHLVSADALTAAGRGEEALETLEALSVHSRPEESDLEWRRALAALEVSTPRSGRQLNSLQREMMRARGHEHLERVILVGLDPDRSKRALRILFEDALEEDRFDDALTILRRIQAIDPQDKSGAPQLWQYGWKQYQQRNYSGAIGYWTELAALYPTSSYNRSGLYWSARAHEALGNLPRARQLLAEVARVPFTDFYRRQALRRLGTSGAAQADLVAPTEPWPSDPVLARAQRLADWGLDKAALQEIDALSERTEPRAAGALRALVLSAAGERRRSIDEIRKVFSLLGTPFQDQVPDRARLLYYPLAFDQLIEQNAARNGLDRNLVLAMIRQESAFDPGAHSRSGARGLMQVMPATGREIARRLGLSYSHERLSDPSFSIRLGTTYYKQVRAMFGDDEELALAGYNAGPYRIKRLWRLAGTNAELDRFLETLELAETRSYVKRVLLFADSYRRLYPTTEPEVGPPVSVKSAEIGYTLCSPGSGNLGP